MTELTLQHFDDSTMTNKLITEEIKKTQREM